ncbi:hypothetical protein M5585_11010 [Serratia ureilytica]
MTDVLIYSERGLLPRVVDSLLTLFAWCGFLYLFSRGLMSVMDQHGVGSALSLLEVISLYIIVALFNAVTLIAWPNTTSISPVAGRPTAGGNSNRTPTSAISRPS